MIDRAMADIELTTGLMGSRKSAILLMDSFEATAALGPEAVLVFKSSKATRGDDPMIIDSRSGVSPRLADALIEDDTDMCHLITTVGSEALRKVFVDEVQFLTIPQIEEMHKVMSSFGISFGLYGLYKDFRAWIFPTTERAIELSTRPLRMLPKMCDTMHVQETQAAYNIRLINGLMSVDGKEIGIESDVVQYKSLCLGCVALRAAEANIIEPFPKKPLV